MVNDERVMSAVNGYFEEHDRREKCIELKGDSVEKLKKNCL